MHTSIVSSPKLRASIKPLPCCGCGYCCIKVPCCEGAYRWGPNAPCGGLRWDEEKQRFWCQVILDAPESKRDRLKEEMAMGAGCSSTLFNDHRDSFLSGQGKDYLIRVCRWKFDS